MSNDGPTHDEIAKRAYERYQNRGGDEGCADDDWECAERELREREQQEQPEREREEGLARDE